MYEETKQNGKTMLSSNDGISIPVIFNNLTDRNNTSDYSTYIKFVAIRGGFDYGEIELFRDGKFVKKGTIKRR